MIAYVIYQLYFHPLASYPGPLWAKISGSRRGYHAWRGDLHHDMWRCHQKYGLQCSSTPDCQVFSMLTMETCPYVRYSPNYLLFDTTEACKGLSMQFCFVRAFPLTDVFPDIYGHNKNLRKSAPYLAMTHNTPSTFTIVSKKEHAWKKRILSQKFSDSAIRSYEPDLLKLVDRFCDALCPKSSEKSAIDQLICSTVCSTPGSRENHLAMTETGVAWSGPFNMSAWC